jgi:hypothetical protein
VLVDCYIYHLRAEDDDRWVAKEMSTQKMSSAAPPLL